MPRLLRPPIPVEVKCRVALRQLGEIWPDDVVEKHKGKLGALLKELLRRLAALLDCETADLHLDHNPALGAREKTFDRKTGAHIGYWPAANNLEFLMYREKRAHQIKTNVRGDGAQHPDRVLIKMQRRVERGPKKRRGPPMRGRGFEKKVKRPWGKRAFDNRRSK